jgi:hypothetical protein
MFVSVRVLEPFIISIIILKYLSKAFSVALLGLNYFLSLISIFSGTVLDQGRSPQKLRYRMGLSWIDYQINKLSTFLQLMVC